MAFYLKINSADRLNPTTTTPASFSIASDRPLIGLELKAIQLPATYYNISAGNNQVYFSDPSAKTVSITPGYYTIPIFLTNLVTALNSAGAGTYSSSQDSLTSKLVVSCTVPFSFNFGNSSMSSAAELMGFSNSNSAAAATTQTGIAPINLSTTLSFHISINGASGVRNMNGSTTSFCIPALTVTQQLSYYEVPLTMPQCISFDPARVLDISIYDDQRRLLTFTSNWYAIFVAKEVA